MGSITDDLEFATIILQVSAAKGKAVILLQVQPTRLTILTLHQIRME